MSAFCILSRTPCLAARAQALGVEALVALHVRQRQQDLRPCRLRHAPQVVR